MWTKVSEIRILYNGRGELGSVVVSCSCFILNWCSIMQFVSFQPMFSKEGLPGSLVDCGIPALQTAHKCSEKTLKSVQVSDCIQYLLQLFVPESQIELKDHPLANF
ncbi:hypothetical protein O6H91_17G039300 [Diphasiastrum complanatum]|uniref:Uncharacterized protein n=1 Tax=Diphasiastrum complanatum TaxID=34168 RepID=A0ACC2B5X4_DIPCM|nr:hypothetical protein O6H91_17G039300 [Diphasiastrum complanatum]